MRARSVAAACLIVVFGSCGGSNNQSSLTITPIGSGGALAVYGPTDFKATLVNSDAPITWSITGGGSISTMTGDHTTFMPPAGSAAETLTATAGDLSATVMIESSPMILTGATIPGLTAPVTVQYDAQDIPHVNCAQAIDCLAVQGYLQARDRLFPMEFLRHVADSNLSAMIGVAGLSQDVQIRNLFVTRAGHPLAQDLAAAMDPTTRGLLDAFLGGVNAYIGYLQQTQGDQPLGGEYQQLPYPLTPNDLQMWTEEDTLALARLEQFQLSETIGEESGYGTFAAAFGPTSDRTIAWIRAAAPTTEQAHTLAETAFTSNVVRKPIAVKATAPNNMAPWGSQLAQIRDSMLALNSKLRPLRSAVGSNNWAVSAAKSKTGVSMVANDPHLGLQYPPLFYLSTMTSQNPADNLNLAGGSFPGLPGALVGRGANVGWGVTVVGYDVTDLYLETLDENPATCPAIAAGVPCVKFNGASVTPVVVPETYMVRVGPGPAGLVKSTTLSLGASAPPPAVLIVPQHGPIISLDATGGTAVSVRWTGQEGNTQDIKAIWGLNTATDVDSAMAALAYFSTGAQNFVLSDDQGNIAYDPHALVPVRNFADARTAQFSPTTPPWFPLPGSGTPNVEWGDGSDNCAAGAGVAAACWIADADLPQGKNPDKGYFFTANADPTNTGSNGGGVSDGNSPLSFPPYLSFDWDDSSGFRATRIDEMLNDTITANGSVGLADMEAIQSDHYSRPGKAFVDIIDTLTLTNTDAMSAKTILDTWEGAGFDCPSGLLGSDPNESPVDPTMSVVENSSGCFLFHAFLRDLLSNVFIDDISLIGAQLDDNVVQATKAMLYMLGPSPAGTTFCDDVDSTGATIATHTCEEQVETALAQAFEQLTGSISENPTDWVWGRVHTLQPVPLLALVTNGYEPGPFARPGGLFTVDVGAPSQETSSGLSFPYASGGNVRHISVMDPATPVVKMQLPGPERDGPDTIIGPDLLGQWVLNEYFDFAFGDQINSVAVSTQTFTSAQ
jgi:penicillin amidase